VVIFLSVDFSGGKSGGFLGDMEGLILVVWTFDKGRKRDILVVFCLYIYISNNWLVV
jgi:hypothetical protein